MDLTTFTTLILFEFLIDYGSGKWTLFKTTQKAETANIELDDNALNSR